MSTLTPPLQPNDHIRRDLSRPLHLVEFGDYECPFCGQAHGIVAALEEALGDRLCFGFRHFPIVGSHPHALLAAEAAEAAGAQGMFWEMHDMLFQNQHALALPYLRQYAQALSLDLARFEHDIQTHRFIEKIRADLHSGAISGVNGTPTFFVNGHRYNGSFDFGSLLASLRLAAAA